MLIFSQPSSILIRLVLHVQATCTIADISLQGLDKLTDNTLVHMAMYTQLSQLSLTRMPKMTPDGVNILRYRLPNLKVQYDMESLAHRMRMALTLK